MQSSNWIWPVYFTKLLQQLWINAKHLVKKRAINRSDLCKHREQTRGGGSPGRSIKCKYSASRKVEKYIFEGDSGEGWMLQRCSVWVRKDIINVTETGNFSSSPNLPQYIKHRHEFILQRFIHWNCIFLHQHYPVKSHKGIYRCAASGPPTFPSHLSVILRAWFKTSRMERRSEEKRDFMLLLLSDSWTAW